MSQATTNGPIQAALLVLYEKFSRTGCLEKSPGLEIFIFSYFLYKRFLEDRLHLLIKHRPELFKGGHIIDVGANLGYTSLLFARALDPGYKVLAFEPESKNFAKLCRAAKLFGKENLISLQHAAVGDRDGFIRLNLSPESHADHSVSTNSFVEAEAGAPGLVRLVALDTFTGEQGLLPNNLAFIKIDVQGFEAAVLAGMVKILKEAGDDLSILLEFDPAGLKRFGGAAGDLSAILTGHGFKLYYFDTRGVHPLGSDEIERRIKAGQYFDVLASKRAICSK